MLIFVENVRIVCFYAQFKKCNFYIGKNWVYNFVIFWIDVYIKQYNVDKIEIRLNSTQSKK